LNDGTTPKAIESSAMASIRRYRETRRAARGTSPRETRRPPPPPIAPAAEEIAASASRYRYVRGGATTPKSDAAEEETEVRSIHWSPYDRVRVVNAVP
jgi:hypothetical protein